MPDRTASPGLRSVINQPHTVIIHIMGFSSSNYTPAPTPLPVVTQTATSDTKEAVEQSNAQKKGLLSTILSSQRRKQTTATTNSGNATLG